MDPNMIMWMSYLKTCDVLFLISAQTPAVSLALACLEMSGWHVSVRASQARMLVFNNPSGAQHCWGVSPSQCSILNVTGQIYTAAGHVLGNICWSRTVVGEDAATTQVVDLPPPPPQLSWVSVFFWSWFESELHFMICIKAPLPHTHTHTRTSLPNSLRTKHWSIFEKLLPFQLKLPLYKRWPLTLHCSHRTVDAWFRPKQREQ